jgi:hypothetical protein
MADPCASIKQAADGLRHQIEQIQLSPGYIQGPHDPHPGRPDPEMLAEVKALWTQVAKKNAEYNTCELSNGGKPDLLATFASTATLTTTNAAAAGPFARSVSLGALFFHYQHTTLSVTAFPTITVGPFQTPLGSNTTTVTMSSGGQGTYDPATGLLTVSLTLHFHHTIGLAGDSDLPLTLSTESMAPKGSRLSATGAITLAGSGFFQGGFLGGDRASLALAGTITPHP